MGHAVPCHRMMPSRNGFLSKRLLLYRTICGFCTCSGSCYARWSRAEEESKTHKKYWYVSKIFFFALIELRANNLAGAGDTAASGPRVLRQEWSQRRSPRRHGPTPVRTNLRPVPPSLFGHAGEISTCTSTTEFSQCPLTYLRRHRSSSGPHGDEQSTRLCIRSPSSNLQHGPT